MQERDSTDLLIRDKKKRRTLICRSSPEQGQEVRGLAVLSTAGLSYLESSTDELSKDLFENLSLLPPPQFDLPLALVLQLSFSLSH